MDVPMPRIMLDNESFRESIHKATERRTQQSPRGKKAENGRLQSEILKNTILKNTALPPTTSTSHSDNPQW